MTPLTPKEKQQNVERALVLATAFSPGPSPSDEQLAHLANRLMSDLGSPTLKKIHRRYLMLGPQDEASFRQLVADGAHRSVLTQFIGATQDHPEDNRPSRDSVFREHQARRAKQKSHKPFEVMARLAVPTLAITICALVVPWAVSKTALATGLAVGAGVDIATTAATFFDPLVKGVAGFVMEETGGWLSKALLGVGLFVGWNHAARVLPDLKSTMSEPETAILDSALGPEKDNWKLHAHLRKIPPTDRHLLAHLLPAELRAFLRGSDEDRREILTKQPPPLLAEAVSVLASHPPGFVNFFRASRDLADQCLPSFAQKGFLLNEQLDLNSRLNRWRGERKKKVPTVVTSSSPLPSTPSSSPSV